MEINILIDEEFEDKLDSHWLEGIAEQALRAENAAANVEMGLVITSQDKIRGLNRQYRGIDEPTDVLAFAMSDAPGSIRFVTPPDGVQHLGEVIISFPQAAIQAQEQGHPVKDEIALLVVHGVLHLLGYDDEEPELERRMRAREAAILKSIEGERA